MCEQQDRRWRRQHTSSSANTKDSDKQMKIEHVHFVYISTSKYGETNEYVAYKDETRNLFTSYHQMFLSL